jgi:hypothetical protein
MSGVGCEFLRVAYEADDWLALFLKAGASDGAVQRVGPLSQFCKPRWQGWLHAMQASRFNVYVSVNAIAPRQRRRRRDAICTIRHVFIDADRNATGVLSAISARRDLPPPSYVLRTSPGRAHVMWRVAGFEREQVEGLQRRLARELATDSAATPCTQMTRLPGSWNLKYTPPYQVNVKYWDRQTRYQPLDFPRPVSAPRDQWRQRPSATTDASMHSEPEVLSQACRYVAAVAPAVSGEHGDLRTFSLCCRLVRGFALADGDAFAVLEDWNARCQPPWTERELREKLRRARLYGREPVGGCIRAGP